MNFSRDFIARILKRKDSSKVDQHELWLMITSNQKTWLLSLVLSLMQCVPKPYYLTSPWFQFSLLLHLTKKLHVNSLGQPLSSITDVCNGSSTAQTSSAAPIIIKSLSRTLCNSISTIYEIKGTLFINGFYLNRKVSISLSKTNLLFIFLELHFWSH